MNRNGIRDRFKRYSTPLTLTTDLQPLTLDARYSYRKGQHSKPFVCSPQEGLTKVGYSVQENETKGIIGESVLSILPTLQVLEMLPFHLAASYLVEKIQPFQHHQGYRKAGCTFSPSH